MLIEEPRAVAQDIILAMVSGDKGSKRLDKGVYEIGHFGGSHFLPSYEQWVDDLSIAGYGVADTWQQVLEKCPELAKSDRQFVLTIHPLHRDQEPESGGWRWHKWGPYIGDQFPQREYLHDEPEIETVVVYHIYERKQ